MKILFLAPINFNTNIRRKLKEKYNVNFLYGINKHKLKKIISSYDILITNPGSTYRYDSKILSFAHLGGSGVTGFFMSLKSTLTAVILEKCRRRLRTNQNC